jgi:hypothetical protein
MKTLLGLVLLATGAFLIYTGYRRANSLLGETKSVLVDVQDSIDGGYRTAAPVWYYTGGAACLVVGGLLLVRRK